MAIDKPSATPMDAAELAELRQIIASLPEPLRGRFWLNDKGLCPDYGNAFVSILSTCGNIPKGWETVEELKGDIERMRTYLVYLEEAMATQNSNAQKEKDKVQNSEVIAEALNSVLAARLLDDVVADIKMFAVQHRDDLGDHLDELVAMAKEGSELMVKTKQQ